MSVNSLHEELRSKTTALHSALELRSPLGPLLAHKVFDTHAYAQVLMDFEEVFAALEPLSEAFLCQMPLLNGTNEESKRDLLNRRVRARQDLLNLGLQTRPVRPELVKQAADIQSSAPDQLWGVSYVLLGQMLGAKQIAAGLHRCAGFDPSVVPTSFFCAHSRSAALLWRNFLELLNHSQAGTQEALCGAQRAFAAFLSIWPAQRIKKPAEARPDA